MRVIIDCFWSYRSRADKAQGELAKKDTHIDQVEKTVADQSRSIVDLIHKAEALTAELDKSKQAETEATRRMKEAELKVFAAEAKLLEIEANSVALIFKVEALEEEKARQAGRLNTACMDVWCNE